MSIPTRNSDPAKIHSNRRCFFVTASTFSKRALLRTERAALLLIDVLAHYQKQSKFLLHAFVVMPEHFHALSTIDSDMTIEKAVQFIKGGFSFRAGKELALRGEIWQRGFSDVRVLSTEQFVAYKAYILKNPLRRGLCNNPEDFAYSSAKCHDLIDAAPQGLKPASNVVPNGTAKAVP